MNHSLWIRAGWIVDGTGGPIRKNVFVEITGPTIASLEKEAGPPPDAMDFVNLSGHTLIPALLDAHVHLVMSGTDDPEVRRRQLKAPFDEAREVISRHLEEHLSFGVLGLRDGGDHAGHLLRYKINGLIPPEIPVQVRSAGRAWHAKGRYGALIGRPPREGQSLSRAVLEQGDGIDHVKIVHSGLNSLNRFAVETPPQFGLEEIKGAVRAAEARGWTTMVHANGKEPVRTALEAGCHSIEHGFLMGEKNLQRMAERRIPWIPTACTMAAYARTLASGCVEADMARRYLESQIDQMRLAVRYGTPMVVGTDSGSLGVHHGRAVSEEIALFIEAGVPLAQAVECATSASAALTGMEKECGKIAAGMPANFLVLKGGPGEFTRAVASPEMVWIKGRPLPPKHGKAGFNRDPMRFPSPE